MFCHSWPMGRDGRLPRRRAQSHAHQRNRAAPGSSWRTARLPVTVKIRERIGECRSWCAADCALRHDGTQRCVSFFFFLVLLHHLQEGRGISRLPPPDLLKALVISPRNCDRMMQAFAARSMRWCPSVVSSQSPSTRFSSTAKPCA